MQSAPAQPTANSPTMPGPETLPRKDGRSWSSHNRHILRIASHVRSCPRIRHLPAPSTIPPATTSVADPCRLLRSVISGKRRIELIDGIYEAALTAIPMTIRSANYAILGSPARNLSDQVLPFFQLLPEFLQRFRFRKSPAHPNHRNRLRCQIRVGKFVGFVVCAFRFCWQLRAEQAPLRNHNRLTRSLLGSIEQFDLGLVSGILFLPISPYVLAQLIDCAVFK